VDREALILDLGRDAFQLDVVVSDNGVARRSATVPVNVVVADQNDNRPEFAESLYAVSVSEGAKVGADVVALRAKDVDKVRPRVPELSRNRRLTSLCCRGPTEMSRTA
jgi:hypothetical protein